MSGKVGFHEFYITVLLFQIDTSGWGQLLCSACNESGKHIHTSKSNYAGASGIGKKFKNCDVSPDGHIFGRTPHRFSCWGRK